MSDDKAIREALRIARERGWPTADGWIWELPDDGDSPISPDESAPRGSGGASSQYGDGA